MQAMWPALNHDIKLQRRLTSQGFRTDVNVTEFKSLEVPMPEYVKGADNQANLAAADKQELDALREAFARWPNVEHVQDLEDITQIAPTLLTSITLHADGDNTLDLLAKCPNLRSVVMDGSSDEKAPKFAPLALCPFLEHVLLWECKWTNDGQGAPVTQLRSLSMLRALDLERTGVVDVSPVGKATHLGLKIKIKGR
ncbi:hypothetical protein FOA52_005538 [Chlamydomonas sp. UWO 241]|nr:hypothetical protein FOA52_005538 [Chlamydomonas sp. UWO 241]